MDDLRVRPMTQDEFDAFRSRLIRSYAADHVRAGNWSPDDAEARAAQQTDELLPAGLQTEGTLLLVAETADAEPIGHVWVTLDRQPGSGSGAWIYDIEVLEEHRGKGYGRALLQAAERETARHGVTAIGLNVFAANPVARHLYESAGYEPTSLQMRKGLIP
jgi:GNAT superfamily N-acetyltransferase